MKDFFKSKRFQVLLGVFTLLFAFMVKGLSSSELMPFLSQLSGVVLTPISKITSVISGSTTDHLSPYFSVEGLKSENERLKEENQKLMEQMVDHQNLQIENDQFREFLEIKEHNKDFVFEPATVIGRSPDARFGSFIIDVGSYHGVSLRDPVITPDGIIGIVTSVSYGYSKVSTVLDITVDIGVVDSRTLDTGVVSGNINLAQESLCRLNFLARDSGVAVGDIITTSGASGLLPRGLIVGTVKSIETDVSGLSLYGVIQPHADVYGAKSVSVIKDFTGKEENEVME